MQENLGLSFEDNAEQTDYDLAPDGKFTADNQEAILLKREALDREIKCKAAFMKVVEIASINGFCYSVARLLVLTGGFGQVWFACAFVFLCQQIQNRDIFSDFNVNYDEGWQMKGGVAVLRFLGSLFTTGLICWISMGDVINSHWVTQETYKLYTEQIQVYNEAPKDEQAKMIGMVLVGALSVLVILGIYANISRNNNI